MRKVSLFALMSCTLFVPACSQSAHQRTSPDTKPSAIDTTFLRDLAETRNFSAGRPSRIQLTPDGAEVLFLRCGPRDVVQNLYELKVADQSVRCLLKAEDLLAGKEESLTAEEKAARERTRETRTGITWYDLSEDGRQILTGLSGRLYTIDRVSGKITALSQSAAGPARDARFSFDGKFVACIRGYDVHVIDLATNEDRALTTGGTQDLAHGVAEFVAAEEMDRRTGYWWSGDSKFIAYTEVDHRDVPMRYIADATHPEVEPSGWRYPNAGANNAIVRLGVIPLAGGETNWADWNRDELPYLATVRSEKDSPMTVYVQSRDQQSAVLCRLDPATAELSELLAEKDAAWINIEPGMPRWLKDSTFLWISEVSGEKQLELRAADGAKMRIIPAESERFEGLVAIDQTTGEFIIRAGAWPSESHLYRVGHTAGNLRGARLSEGRGEHSAVFSKNGDTWVQSSALADGRETQTLRRRDGAVLGELPSVAEKP
ncbi:MAG TPA: DPP IV N-terminal domain-containing protein, partial [Phycisphaerae bacterium]|nr:DPP IV N-terminal domain-containing protein [Phycisphaerae bacterium]